jgi:hypothetical protein
MRSRRTILRHIEGLDWYRIQVGEPRDVDDESIAGNRIPLTEFSQKGSLTGPSDALTVACWV